MTEVTNNPNLQEAKVPEREQLLNLVQELIEYQTTEKGAFYFPHGTDFTLYGIEEVLLWSKVKDSSITYEEIRAYSQKCLSQSMIPLPGVKNEFPLFANYLNNIGGVIAMSRLLEEQESTEHP